MRFIAFIGSMRDLKLGGRVAASAAALGGMLHISPVVALVDGEGKAVGKVRVLWNGLYWNEIVQMLPKRLCSSGFCGILYEKAIKTARPAGRAAF